MVGEGSPLVQPGFPLRLWGRGPGRGGTMKLPVLPIPSQWIMVLSADSRRSSCAKSYAPLVGRTFLSAGSGDILVPGPCPVSLILAYSRLFLHGGGGITFGPARPPSPPLGERAREKWKNKSCASCQNSFPFRVFRVFRGLLSRQPRTPPNQKTPHLTA